MTTQLTHPRRVERTAPVQAVLDLARRHPLPGLALLALGAAVLAWLRIPALARDTLWAEDGRNFLQGAIDQGSIGSLFIPYAGYLHTVPRLLAAVVVQLAPVADWAQGMTAGSCLVAGVLAATVFVCTRDVIRWVPGRVAIALLTVLAPLAPREVLGNAANLHSLFLWTLFWILIARPRGRAAMTGLAVIGLLGALTEIQAVLLLPLLLFRMRDRCRWPVRAAIVVGVLAQLVVTVIWQRPAAGHAPDGILSILYGYLINAVMPLALPQQAIGPTLVQFGPLVGLALLVPIAAMAAVAIRRGTSTQCAAVIALATASLVLFCVAVAANPNTFYEYAVVRQSRLGDPWLTRYGVVPSMMLAAIMVIGAGILVRGMRWRDRLRSSMRPAVILLVVCGMFGALILGQFIPEQTRRSAGPAWQPQLTAAEDRCEIVPADSRVVLRETLNWSVAVPCSRILSDSARPR